MSDTTYIDKNASTPVVASWLNDVNILTYRALGSGGVPPTTATQVLSNLGLSAASGSSLIGYTQGGTGSVTRNAQYKFLEQVNVDDYIPPGTDTTVVDCGPYFILAAAASQYVRATAGKTYFINTAITGAFVNVTFDGQSCILHTTKTTNFNIFYLPNTASGNEIKGFKFQGTATTDTASPVIGVYMYQSSRNNVHHNIFTGLNYGGCSLDITAGAATNPIKNKFNFNTVLDCVGPTNGGYGFLNVRSIGTEIIGNVFGNGVGTIGRHCIYVSAGSVQCVVQGNQCTGSVLAPITIYSGTGAGDDVVGNIVTGNTVIGSALTTANSYGIAMTGLCYKNIVANNQIWYACQNGIFVQSADATHVPDRNIFLANQISNSGVEGIMILDATNNSIQGNILDKNNVSNLALNDIVIQANNTASANGNVVMGNISRNPSNAVRHNVTLGAGTSGNVVQSNQFADATQLQILDNGNNNVIPLQGGMQTITYAATITPDPTAGEVVKCTLTGNLTIANPAWPMPGQRVTFILTQDGIGGRTVTWGSLFDAVWSDTGNTLNKISNVSFINDGVKYRQVGAQTTWH